MTTPAEIARWLGGALGRPEVEPEALAAALEAEPGPPVLVVDAHLLMLRTVGGFAGLRWLLEVMQGTAQERFWVVAMRSSTWRFLEGVPAAADLGLFRERVRVEPLRGAALEAWLLGPPLEAGLVPSFAGLAGERVNARALARARVTWLRLIEDMSQGRPLVARALWRRSLGDGELPDVVEHGPPDQPGADALAGLSTEDLFLLTALAVHGELDGPSLVEVLNVGASRIRGACRRLQAQGILISDEDRDRYEIEPLVHPLVLRLLRQRAFLVTA